jgi:hypothetical protein
MPLTDIETHKVKPKEDVLEVHNLPDTGSGRLCCYKDVRYLLNSIYHSSRTWFL